MSKNGFCSLSIQFANWIWTNFWGWMCFLFLVFVSCLALQVSKISKVQAQAPERISQQTYPYTFTVIPDGTAKTFPVNNLGQSAHTIALPQMNHTSTACVWWFEGSNDRVNYSIMAVIPTNLEIVNVAIAQGQFTFFQLVFNPLADTACTGGVAANIYYVGYQFPLSLPPQTQNFTLTGVKDPEYIYGQDAAPEILTGIQCYNPNATEAFLEVFDAAGSGTAPTLPGSPVFFYEIDATHSVPISTNSLRLKAGGWLAAVTTLNGSTVVTTSLTCSVQVNLAGPFL